MPVPMHNPAALHKKGGLGPRVNSFSRMSWGSLRPSAAKPVENSRFSHAGVGIGDQAGGIRGPTALLIEKKIDTMAVGITSAPQQAGGTVAVMRPAHQQPLQERLTLP